MTLDTVFLREYLNKEIRRLSRVVAREKENIFAYQQGIAMRRTAIEGDTVRKWEYGNGIQNLEGKMLQADVKIAAVQGTINKLSEAEAALSV